MNIRAWHLALVAFAVVTPASFAADAANLATEARSVLKTHCSSCHVGDGSENGYKFDALDLATMIKAHGDDEPAVLVPKDLAKSRIWVRAGMDKNMPPKNKPRPSAAELETLKKWIEAGAPAVVAGPERKFIGPLVQLKMISEHFSALDPDDRSQYRYFTLTHLHNNPGVTAEDIRVQRAALSKAINSMSRQPRLELPKAIDKDETIFAVNIKNLGWDKHRLWNRILTQYPYGLDYSGSDDESLRRIQKDIDRLAPNDLVYIRSDWFVATATRAPLYHDLLQLPKTTQELRAELKVDRDANIRKDAVWRAGFQASGVSAQNRMVERHDSPVSNYYWESYDFLPRKARANLLRFPLGPSYTGNDFERQAFNHDGGEMIFGLANGLQGYMLADGKGNRIDQGPLDVVSDSLKTSGSPAIVNGMSCMHCHKNGMIPCIDTVRDNHALSGDARDKVLRLYPESKAFNELLKADEDRFVNALEKTIGPFLRVGADKGKPIRELIEPVGEVARSYRVGKSTEIDLVKAACELGIEKPDVLAGMIKGNPALKELGVLTLANGKTVKRDDWDSIDGTSLFQDVALALRLGSPKRFR